MMGIVISLLTRLSEADSTGVTLFAVCVALLLYPICYYIILHPLAQYPGLFLAKFTNLYAAYHAWTEDIHIDIYRCHQRYGAHVRYAPNRLVINTAEALHDIYGHHAKVNKYRNYRVLSQQAPNTLTMQDKAQHSRRRRVIGQAFSTRGLEAFQPKILARLDRLRQHLAFDTMTSVSFDADYDTLRSPKYRSLMDAIEESNIRQGVLLQADSLATANLDRKLFPSSIAARAHIVKFVRGLLATRMSSKTPTSHNDIFSFLQQCRDPDTGDALTITELSTETATFIVAGSDTTATSMASIVYYLAHSPPAYHHATTEIRNTFPTLSQITLGPALNECIYLRSCISESLRLSPPGGSALFREIESCGAVIDGTFLPAGVEVGVGIYSIHHTEKYYSNAMEFRPERWLNTELGNGEKNGDNLPYMPFSIGPRSCIGKPLAVAQVMLTLARLLWEFDFRVVGGDEGGSGEYRLRDHVVGSKTGPVLSFRVRDDGKGDD
ncbi:putative cytochrome P450 [Aspergillus ellipticus CBS 707.79]|uniref:Putative cytochrome P450 n=1 Tax=Aspergillus ellipticus CBS 707.79 TaxID=1448320 RepID=A0A319EPN8_9EURO|nr:putative cytochrome P450 [Aspergillus ellipticus CBS 707.79]